MSAMKFLISNLSMPHFSGRHVPINKVSEIMAKNPQCIREGLKSGKLPIGFAIPNDVGGYTYYISPKLLYEYTGAIVNGVEDGETDEQLDGRMEEHNV